MTASPYNPPCGGLPPQTALMTGRAVFTEAYAVIPKGVMRDIVTSVLPFWEGTRAWMLSRPLSGFSETFAQYLMEVAPGGGSERPEPDACAEGVLFVVGGRLRLVLEGQAHALRPGSYVYLPPGAAWSLRGEGTEPARFHWIRKAYQRVEGIASPPALVTHESEVAPAAMPDTDGAWATTRFVSPEDVRHDMHVNIVTLRPGASIDRSLRGRAVFEGGPIKVPAAKHPARRDYEHPVVLPQVSHFRQVPLRTSVKFAHSGQASPT